MTFKVRYSSIDGAGKSRSFKTLKGAQKFAHYWIGPHPDIGSYYAVSNDGVGKITVQGCTLAELFPPAEVPVDPRSLPTEQDEYEAWCAAEAEAAGEAYLVNGVYYRTVRAYPPHPGDDEIPF